MRKTPAAQSGEETEVLTVDGPLLVVNLDLLKVTVAILYLTVRKQGFKDTAAENLFAMLAAYRREESRRG